MVKKGLILFSFLLCINIVYAQISGIRVYVIDKSTMLPIAYALVTAEENGLLVAGTISDDNGMADLKPLDTGKYDIYVDFIGYKTTIQASVPVVQRGKSTLVVEMTDKFGDIIPSESIINVKPQVGDTVFSNSYVMIDTSRIKSSHINTDSILAGLTEIPLLCPYNNEPVGGCWSSGNFNRGDLNSLPTNDLNYVLGFFPKH